MLHNIHNRGSSNLRYHSKGIFLDHATHPFGSPVALLQSFRSGWAHGVASLSVSLCPREKKMASYVLSLSVCWIMTFVTSHVNG